ncbi:hypothetical protein [Endozoicomonas sp. ALB115]|uniref:hypothetical protein n=1 Tax=Endozoicomonas sp. ALB115 TaxID=3403074 RepID=UPI003BB6C384
MLKKTVFAALMMSSVAFANEPPSFRSLELGTNHDKVVITPGAESHLDGVFTKFYLPSPDIKTAQYAQGFDTADMLSGNHGFVDESIVSYTVDRKQNISSLEGLSYAWADYNFCDEKLTSFTISYSVKRGNWLKKSEQEVTANRLAEKFRNQYLDQGYKATSRGRLESSDGRYVVSAKISENNDSWSELTFKLVDTSYNETLRERQAQLDKLATEHGDTLRAKLEADEKQYGM